jgi:predicted DNA-binding transcriptional regulator AlpA
LFSWVFERMGFESFFFDSMVSILLNEDPQLDHVRAHTSHTRRSIVRTVKNFDDLDIPVVCHNMKPLRLKYNQVCELLNVTRDCLRKIIENDPTFPRFLKEGTSRQAAVYFDTEEIEEWYRNYKTKCRGER